MLAYICLIAIVLLAHFVARGCRGGVVLADSFMQGPRRECGVRV
jgi:hypothetical protein